MAFALAHLACSATALRVGGMSMAASTPAGKFWRFKQLGLLPAVSAAAAPLRLMRSIRLQTELEERQRKVSSTDAFLESLKQQTSDAPEDLGRQVDLVGFMDVDTQLVGSRKERRRRSSAASSYYLIKRRGGKP